MRARNWIGYTAATGIALLAGLVGCQTTPADAPPPGQVSNDSQTTVIAGADADRAKDAIQEERANMSGERQPAAPPAGRPVDQPRAGSGRR